MKTIINSCKRTCGFKVSIAFLICLFFLTLPSCQKADNSFLTQESLTGLTTKAISTTTGVLYYGHDTFTRTSGTPGIEILKIENPEFDCFNGNFVLKIQNGNDKRSRVSSAEIKIDGELIIRPSDFSKNVSFITRPLSGLTPESILEVKLNGTPGSFIDLWIEGTLKEVTAIDIDGNIYKTVTIGSQVWMAENLRSIHYQNGDPIAYVTDNSVWLSLTTGAYCWQNNNVSNKFTYGALYNWYVVSDGRKICPTGWHVPSNPEWCLLINYLGGQYVAGGKLKEDGLTHWSDPNIGATNESGFTALPGGYREGDNNGLFVDQGFTAKFWSTTEQNEFLAFYQNLSTFNQWAFCQSDINYKKSGSSIRCVKD